MSEQNGITIIEIPTDKEITEFEEKLKADKNIIYLDEIKNAIDSLEVASILIHRNNNLKWKYVTMAISHSLYSFCICSLHNGSNISLIGKYKDNNDSGHKFTCDGINFKKSEKNELSKNSVYRIIWNKITDNQEIDTILYRENLFNSLSDDEQHELHYKNDDCLIGFWTALARVMDGVFWMGRTCVTKPLILSDNELFQIEYIHNLRNDFEHFVPKSAIYNVKIIKECLLVYCKSIKFLVNESCALFVYVNENNAKKINKLIDKIEKGLI